MKITKVTATCHSVPVMLPYQDKPHPIDFFMVRVETDAGIVGHGIGPAYYRFSTREFIHRQLGPFMIGKDPLATEMIWNRDAPTELSSIHASYFGSSEMLRWGFGAIDIALWDIKGKYFNQPIFRLLGGDSNRIPCYITAGLYTYTRDQLAEVANKMGKVDRNHLKMQVSYTKGPDMDEEEARVRTMREAMGDDLMLMVDANDRLKLQQAKDLCSRIEKYDITWFEAPISMTTSIEQLPLLRQSTTIPLGHSGSLPGQRWFYRNMIEAEATDILQPNVVMVGGYTEAIKIANLAQAYNMRVATGAGQPAHNMHLIAGIANGWMVECHYGHVLRDQIIYRNAPHPEQGWLTLPEKPGLGLDVNEEALKKYEEA